MKIKLAAELRHASPYNDLSTNKSLKLSIGYIHVGIQCKNPPQLIYNNSSKE